MNITVIKYETIDSTNTGALKQARQGAEEGLCIVAQEQTAGRGRHGRTWVSDKDSGLYFSIVLRPKLETRFLPLITLMAGVAVHDTLQERGLKPDIKWVNDVLVDEKKISGILAETAETPKGLAVVVGIGINLKSSNFPAELANTATSIADQLKAVAISADTLTESLIKYLSYFYDILSAENGPADIVDEWRVRSSYFMQKPVRVALENETVFGMTDGLEPNGALRIRTSDGAIVIVQAGDVERLRATDDRAN